MSPGSIHPETPTSATSTPRDLSAPTPASYESTLHQALTPGDSHPPVPSGSTGGPTNGNKHTAANTGDGSNRKRRKVTRSKEGCYTCRRRRKLCDFTRPVCHACTRLNLECTWPPDGPSKPPGGDRRSSHAPASLSPTTSVQNAAPHGNKFGYSSPSTSLSNDAYLPSRPFASVPVLPSGDGTSRPSAGTNTMQDFVTIFGDIADPRMTMGLGPGDIHRPTVSSHDGMNGQMGGPHGHIEMNNNTGMSGHPNGMTHANAVAVYGPPEAQHAGPSSEDILDWFSGGASLDESTLQLWAADCLAVPTTQTFNAFDSLNSLLQPTPPSEGPVEPALDCQVSVDDAPSQGAYHPGSARPSSSPSRRSNGRDTPTSGSQFALLSYFHDNLSGLVSCTGDTAPSAFEAFTKLANMTVGKGPAGQGLHLSILAWTARHMVNRGLLKYEAISEKFSSQATFLIDRRIAELFDEQGHERRPNEGGVVDHGREHMTLLAAALMLMQFKICRGDVWGFVTLVRNLTTLVPYVFRPEADVQPDSMHQQFFENILYHDVLCSFILNRKPMVPDSLLNHYCRTGLENLHTLTGASLPLFSTMHRLASLVRQRRSRRGEGWSDENLLDVVQPAMDLEMVLADEKKRLDDLVLAKPHVKPHRYLHEAFRTSCLIQLRYHVLGEPPTSLQIRLLVRQALSLLEAMFDQSLPGICSSHWVIFVAALCCIPGNQGPGEMDDRKRIERIYDDFLHDFGFLNIERSRKIVHEVWARNQGGQLHIDWLDLLEEYDWEIFVV